MQVVSNVKCQLAASLISKGLLQVNDVNKPVAVLQLVDNLQQAGGIRNLQQVCGVSGCVTLV
jgi:hypothetical protein